MREIEFRVVTPVGIFHVPDDSFSLVLHDTGYRVQMWCSDGLVDEFPATSIDQYTGLKDKNGVKIFEGDVIKACDDGSCMNREVIYCGGSGYPAFDLYNNDIEDCNGLSYFAGCGSVEVIGNIHENPELIGGSK